jgi:hypothetical protein
MGTGDVLVFLIFFQDRFIKFIFILLIFDFLISIVKYDMKLGAEVSIKFVCEQLCTHMCD